MILSGIFLTERKKPTTLSLNQTATGKDVVGFYEHASTLFPRLEARPQATHPSVK